MCVKHCKLKRSEQLRPMEFFVAGTPARTACDLVGVHRNSALRFFHKFREKIALKQQDQSEHFCGKIELDESYFGGVRKGKRGRGAAGKGAGFGLLKRGGKVHTQIILDANSNTLMPIIREKIEPDGIVYTDCWRGYNALDVSENLVQEFTVFKKYEQIKAYKDKLGQASRYFIGEFTGKKEDQFLLYPTITADCNLVCKFLKESLNFI